MKYVPKYAMQTCGDLRKWSNPERTYDHILLKMDLECEADPYPGILILTDRNYNNASASLVTNLRKELPKLLGLLGEDAIVYWCMIYKEEDRQDALRRLTSAPVFNDILG